MPHSLPHPPQVTSLQHGKGGAASRLLGRMEIMLLLLWRVLVIVVYLLCSLPGLTLALPVILLTRVLSSRKAQEAKKGSSVKLLGRDVVGTWKILIAMVVVPILHLLYTYTAHALGGPSWSIGYFFFMPYVSYLSIKVLLPHY